MIVMLLAASCAKEQLGNEASGEATMTLTVSLPDNAVTKAYGDGQYAAKNVIIGVFDENGTEKFRKNYVWEPDVFTKELSITFVMGKKYQMVLWAQYGEAYGDPAKMPLDKISLDYKASNREDLDAFYAYVPTFEVREDFTKSITLTRPFAQLNFATTIGDMDESIAAGDLGIHNKAAVTVANVANTLNLLTGKTSYVAADGTETAAGAAVVIPETEFPKVNGKYPTIVVEETTYEVISMNYVLVADNSAVDGKTTVDLKLKVGELEIEVPTAPMKRNYRTNVIGELLTGEGTFTVTIDPIFDGTYNENWNDGSSDEDVVTKTSDWTLLGTHNEWKSDSKMLLENGLAVAKNVVFPATKAVGDHQFKLYKSVAGENGAAVETWVGMSAEVVVPADKYVAAVVGTAGKDVNIAAGTYDIWFDEASEKIYVMTPEKAIKEATEFVAETPEDPDQPVKSAWGIVGSMTSWSGTADAPVADIPMYVEGDYQVAKGVAIAADDAFKFRTNNSWGTELTAGLIEPDKAYNVAPGSGNITVSAAGTYDFYLDVVNNKVYMMTEGKTPADAEVAADYWGVIGTVKDNNWATDVKMTLEGDWYVAKAVELVADANNNDKVVFKFRKNGAWAEQRSTSETAPITLGTEYPTVSNGDAGDIQLSAAGTYDIYLSADLAKFKVVASADTEEPEQPEPIVPAVALTVSPENVPAEGGKVVATVTSNVAWTLSLGETKVAEGTEAVTQKAVEVTIPANTTTEVVTYTLTLSDVPAEGAQAVTATANLTQAAAQPEEPEQPEGPQVVTVAEFLAAPDDETIEYQVSGTIGDIYQAYNPEYDNISFYIKDATGEMLAFRVSCEGITDPATTITKGDEITVKGTRTLYNNVAQMAKGGVIVAHKDVVIEEPEIPESARVISFADKANRTSYSTEQQVWEQDGITVINDKGGSTSNVGDYAAPARFYKNSDLKVQSEGMTKIVFECPTSDNNKYLKPLAEVISGSSVDGGNVIVTFTEPVNEFAVTLTVGQVRVNKIIVYTE